jgi:hypothetical protein
LERAAEVPDQLSDVRKFVSQLAIDQVRAVLVAEGGRSRFDVMVLALDAIDWALDHADAASLPVDTVVASADTAWIKEDPETATKLYSAPGTEPRPWSGCWGDATNAAIDCMLADGTAEVLRVGAGKDAQ